ncbi:hypothetical protein ACFY8F_00825 [Streptomyces tanashiensis]|uniref:hypothetical protein n=1 Tax=Streptomyces tanashiensis TaxID=67367 RepID=UPI0036B26F79
MNDAVLTALVAAGAAIGGGALTGVFALAAARRQAAAAWAAGERQAAAAWEAGRQQAAAAWDAGRLQATAQHDVSRRTLTEQAPANQRAVRRAAYVTFLGRTDSTQLALAAWQSAIGTADESPRRREYDWALAALGGGARQVRTADWLCGAREVDELAVESRARGAGIDAQPLDAVTAGRGPSLPRPDGVADWRLTQQR